MSMFIPTWCVDVLWISFFSVREINKQGKPFRGQPVSSCHPPAEMRRKRSDQDDPAPGKGTGSLEALFA